MSVSDEVVKCLPHAGHFTWLQHFNKVTLTLPILESDL